MRELWDMFLAFARIGGLTFGGGYAMLPMLQREVVEKHHWATEEELADYYAIGQCTPGVIAAPEGLKRLHEAHPDIHIYVGHLDRCLNEDAYICPGLGDAGDRIFGTK